MNVPWLTALVTGACLSATDSASVLGVFREVGAGKRLTTLLEGESLFNGIVEFGLLNKRTPSLQSVNKTFLN
ncbi:MAG: cation:proton antiporter [Chroococcidiopsidaceae cyanobacterium CP_BM_ER_R8_30]|nr:cation:proton antiporter [Chroococcidiopsidaceae cyanobacterium CP_BM_ER_R8_30]